jgi:hypothetical protein
MGWEQRLDDMLLPACLFNTDLLPYFCVAWLYGFLTGLDLSTAWTLDEVGEE